MKTEEQARLEAEEEASLEPKRSARKRKRKQNSRLSGQPQRPATVTGALEVWLLAKPRHMYGCRPPHMLSVPLQTCLMTSLIPWMPFTSTPLVIITRWDGARGDELATTAMRMHGEFAAYSIHKHVLLFYFFSPILLGRISGK